jgi:hypothetical protein
MSLKCAINHCGAPHGHRHREVPHPRLFVVVSSPFCPKTSICPGHQPSTASGVNHGSTGGLEIEKAFRECVKIALFMMKKEERKSQESFRRLVL